MTGSFIPPRHPQAGAVYAALALIAITMTAGCIPNAEYVTEERRRQGVVFILPGIEGISANNVGIQQGLADGGVPFALRIYPWGFPVPGVGMLINQTDVVGNRNAGGRLADEIVAYQQAYPGRGVFLIGHSGGGGIAVFAMESLAGKAGAKPIDGAFLVSASLSSDYDLSSALRMTRRGLVNIYNSLDTSLLGVGTAVFGNVDGGHGDSTGRTGFYSSYPKVYEMEITGEQYGTIGDPHTIATSAAIVADYAPPWLMSPTWPPSGPSPNHLPGDSAGPVRSPSE